MKEDLVDYLFVIEKYVDIGMKLGEIVEVVVCLSDNIVGNILFNKIGGFKGYEKVFRYMGDWIIMFDCFEIELNEVILGDICDISIVKVIVMNFKVFMVGNVFFVEKCKIFIEWMKGNVIGDKFICVGVLIDWVVGDKLGVGSYGIRNDIVIVWFLNRVLIIIVILFSKDEKEVIYDN